MNLVKDTESISSCSDISELEDGEVIDDSDSDLSVIYAENCLQHATKLVSCIPVTGSETNLSYFKKHRHSQDEDGKQNCKENSCVTDNYSTHKISSQNEPLFFRITSDAGSHRTQKKKKRHKDPVKKFHEMHKEWELSADLITIDEASPSPERRKKFKLEKFHWKEDLKPPRQRKRKKSLAGRSKQDLLKNIKNERKNSRKKRLVPKINTDQVERNPLLTKLVLAGDINPENIILNEKNEISDCRLSFPKICGENNDLSQGNSEKSIALDDLSTEKVFCSPKNITSKSPCKFAKHSSSSSTFCPSPEKVPAFYPSNYLPVNNSEMFSQLNSTNSNDSCDEFPHFNTSIKIPKDVTSTYLKTPPKIIPSLSEEIYSPETFVPCESRSFNGYDTNFNASSVPDSPFVSENYDCIPMSCSEDEEIDGCSKTINSVVKQPVLNVVNQIHEVEVTESDEEEQELQLRIGALKTWLQKKYSKPKSEVESCKDIAKSVNSSECSKSRSMQNVSGGEVGPTTRHDHMFQNVHSVDLNHGASIEMKKPRTEVANNSLLLDDEANEDYETALRSLLVSSLLKKKLKNSNELLTESSLFSKTCGVLKSNNSFGKTSNLSQKAKSSSDLLKPNPFKNSVERKTQSTLTSTSKPDLINNCDKLQSKYSLSNSNETSVQIKDSRNSNLISNIQPPVVEKLIINLDDDSDTDSDESREVQAKFKVTTSEEKSARVSNLSNVAKCGVVRSPKKSPKSSTLPLTSTHESVQPGKSEVCAKFSLDTKAYPDVISKKSFKQSLIIKDSTKLDEIPVNEPKLTTALRSTVEETLTTPIESNLGNLIAAGHEKSILLNIATVSKSELNFEQSTNTPSVSIKVVEPKLISFDSNQIEPVSESSILSSLKTVLNVPGDKNTQNSINKQIGEQCVKSLAVKSSKKLDRPVVLLSLDQKNLSQVQSTSTKKKVKKPNNSEVTDVLVPVEKKLLKARLNLLQNLDTMQGCIGSCEESAIKSSRLFAKVLQLQKALRVATSNYKAQFTHLKACVKNYKLQSQNVTTCFSEYAQVQKTCVSIGQNITGMKYSIPKEGLSAMATKFKLIKEKKLEFLKNPLLMSEMRKASESFNSAKVEKPKTTLHTMEVEISLTNSENLHSSLLNSVALPASGSLATQKEDSLEEEKSVHFALDGNSFQTPELKSNILKTDNVVDDCAKKNTDFLNNGGNTTQSSNDSVGGKNDLQKNIVNSFVPDKTDKIEVDAIVSKENCDNSSKTISKGDGSECVSIIKTAAHQPSKVDFECEVADRCNLGLVPVLDSVNPSIFVEGKPAKCLQSFRKYTSVLQSLSSSGSGSDPANIDAIICPFSLQGTCRDDTCEYKHIQS